MDIYRVKSYRGQAERDKADISKMELRLGKARRFWKGMRLGGSAAALGGGGRRLAPTYFITARRLAAARLVGGGLDPKVIIWQVSRNPVMVE